MNVIKALCVMKYEKTEEKQEWRSRKNVTGMQFFVIDSCKRKTSPAAQSGRACFDFYRVNAGDSFSPALAAIHRGRSYGSVCARDCDW